MLRPASLLSSRLIRAGIVAWSAIGMLILGYFVWRFALYPIRIVFAPLLIGLVIVYLLNPVVTRLHARGVPRVWGTLLAYAVLLTAVGVLLRFLIPVIADQVSGFVGALPDLIGRAQQWLDRVIRRFRPGEPGTDFLRSLDPGGVVGAFISRLFGFTVGALHVLLDLVLGAVLGFYLLVDLPKVQQGLISLIPVRRRDEVREVLGQMGRALGGFFRGQLLVALFVGLASMLALFVVGLPYWALVGAVAGLFNLIPLVGPFIGAVPALFIAFTTDQSGGLLHLEPGWALAVGSSVALLTVQQIDNHIISPNVVARTVKLHPVSVMLGLLVGGTLLGLVGMLLTVPVIASVKILLLRVWDRAQWPPGRPVAQPDTLEDKRRGVVRSQPVVSTAGPPEADPAGARRSGGDETSDPISS